MRIIALQRRAKWWKERKDELQLLGLRQAYARKITPKAPKPKTKRLVVRCCFEKCLKVRCIVDTTDPFIWRLLLELIPWMSCWVICFPTFPSILGIPDARPPPFTGESNCIAMFLKQIWVKLPLFRQKGIVITSFFQLP